MELGVDMLCARRRLVVGQQSVVASWNFCLIWWVLCGDSVDLRATTVSRRTYLLRLAAACCSLSNVGPEGAQQVPVDRTLSVLSQVATWRVHFAPAAPQLSFALRCSMYSSYSFSATT